MADSILYGSLGAMGAPLTSTLVAVDGSFVMAIGLAAVLIGGVLLSAAVRNWRARRRAATRPVRKLRRAAA